MRRTAVIPICLIMFINLQNNLFARDLIAAVGIVPPHAIKNEEGDLEGGFIELVRAMDRVYTEGKIIIKLVPVKRAMNSLKDGEVDFMLPYIYNSEIPDTDLFYTFPAEPITDVAFVLYTSAEKPALDIDKLGRYEIETLRGAQYHFNFKISAADSFRQGLQRVSLGRTDGFIGEQDACDLIIKQNHLSNLRRTLYANWISTIIIPKGPGGAQTDKIISTALRDLKHSGELQKITSRIHLPFENWQPYLSEDLLLMRN